MRAPAKSSMPTPPRGPYTWSCEPPPERLRHRALRCAPTLLYPNSPPFPLFCICPFLMSPRIRSQLICYQPQVPMKGRGCGEPGIAKWWHAGEVNAIRDFNRLIQYTSTISIDDFHLGFLHLIVYRQGDCRSFYFFFPPFKIVFYICLVSRVSSFLGQFHPASFCFDLIFLKEHWNICCNTSVWR